MLSIGGLVAVPALSRPELLAAPASGDYHLGSGTPLIRGGPPFVFQPADLDGHPFPPSNGFYPAEMGAYLDTIFFCGHEGLPQG